MNFQWKDDIYDDWNYGEDDDPPPEQTKRELNERFVALLPGYCKVIGIVIAFLPVIFKILQLNSSPVVSSINISDRILYSILLFGLLIEVVAKNRMETFREQHRRYRDALVLFGLFIMTFIPLFAGFWHSLWT